jgi:cell division septum initiation protein DivIVA
MLYELKFGAARRQFDAWQGDHPDDPLGAVSMAASYLFVEFYCQRVLTSDYFLDDDRLLHGIKGKPDAVRSSGFRKANQRAMELARSKLAAGTSDTNALLALTLATGMQADYESILEKRQMESLHLIKEAEDYAKRLLALKPDMADAWLALGAANYIIGCLPLHVRFFLWFGGIRGDRRLGMEQLRMTAEYGHYLKPFAKILLALASMREKQYDLAREQLVDLASEFPDNYLFRAELARLRHRDGAGPAASYTQEGRSAVCGCDRQYSLTRGGFEKASGARIFWPLRRNPLLSLE